MNGAAVTPSNPEGFRESRGVFSIIGGGDPSAPTSPSLVRFLRSTGRNDGRALYWRARSLRPSGDRPSATARSRVPNRSVAAARRSATAARAQLRQQDPGGRRVDAAQDTDVGTVRGARGGEGEGRMRRETRGRGARVKGVGVEGVGVWERGLQDAPE